MHVNAMTSMSVYSNGFGMRTFQVVGQMGVQGFPPKMVQADNTAEMKTIAKCKQIEANKENEVRYFYCKIISFCGYVVS